MTPDSPAVSPVPPTATDLISREAAIEALETWIANQPDGHYFGAWAVAIREAQKILETLPSSAPPVAPALTHEDLQKAAAIAGADGCYFCALWFRQMFRRHTPPLPIHDFILAPASSVGELEAAQLREIIKQAQEWVDSAVGLVNDFSGLKKILSQRILSGAAE